MPRPSKPEAQLSLNRWRNKRKSTTYDHIVGVIRGADGPRRVKTKRNQPPIPIFPPAKRSLPLLSRPLPPAVAPVRPRPSARARPKRAKRAVAPVRAHPPLFSFPLL